MFTKREKSRFASYSQLKSINNLVEKIRKKQEQLKSCVDENKKNTIDYKKHAILEKIIQKFDILIDNFNKNNKPGRLREDKLKEINLLLIGLVLVLGKLKENEIKIIITPRNNHRRYMNYLLNYGVMGTSGAIGTVVSGPLLGLGLLFSSGVVSHIATNQMGMKDITPTSGLLVNELLKNIMKVFRHNVNSLGDSCDFQPLTFEKHEWLNDDEFNEDKIQPATIYLHANKTSIVCLYKDNKGSMKVHPLNDFLDEDELLQMREQKKFGVLQKFAIIAAITKSICSLDYTEINQDIPKVNSF
ncbi:MAG: hypothetical protein HYX60_07840 [Legionella longbeachae]|nr:hypothetical protein [Legionella longbeachae]